MARKERGWDVGETGPVTYSVADLVLAVLNVVVLDSWTRVDGAA